MSLNVKRIAIPEPDLLELSPPGAGSAVNLPYVRQTEDNWCWAACGEMLLHLPGHVQKTQCAIADFKYGPGCCTVPHAPASCDQGCWPHLVYPELGLATAAHVPVDQNGIQSPLFFEPGLRAALVGKPVQVCFEWSDGVTTHVVLVVGVDANDEFILYDPQKNGGISSCAFDQIVTAGGEGTWIAAFTF